MRWNARTACSRATKPSPSPIVTHAGANLVYAERIVKFLLWARGGWKVTIGGPATIGEHIRSVYSPDGVRQFDHHFMGEQVYQHPFTVVSAAPTRRRLPMKAAKPSAATWTATASASTWAHPT